MSKSNISILAKSISSKKGLSQADAERFISKMFEVANEGLQEDKQLKMKWLGTFKVTAVKDRESVDVNTGERIVIEGRDKISFTPDNILKEIVNKPFAQFETVVVNDGVDFSDIDEKFSLQAEEAEDASAARVNQQKYLASEGHDAVDGPMPTDEQVADEQVAADADEYVAGEHVAASEPMIAEMPNAIGENKTAEESINQPESKGFDETKIAEEQKVGDQPTAKEHPSAESQPVAEVHPMAEEPQMQPLVENTSIEQGSLVNEDLVTQESSLVKNASDNEAGTSNDAAANHEAVSSNDAAAKHEAVSSNDAVTNEEIIISNEAGTSEPATEVEEEEHSHHLMIPKYMVAIVCLAFVILLGGMGWFAFNFGKMQAQRDQLAMQIQTMKKPAPVAAKDTTQKNMEDSAALALKKKAQEDSIRMAETSKAVEMAEKTEQNKVDETSSAKTSSTESSSQGKGATQNKAVAPSDPRSSSYDADPRVRTGAYRIVGVAQTLTVKEGQTLTSLSSQYLGPGMECYVEAVNGSKEVKAGQKIKIPKLELKRKKK